MKNLRSGSRTQYGPADRKHQNESKEAGQHQIRQPSDEMSRQQGVTVQINIGDMNHFINQGVQQGT